MRPRIGVLPASAAELGVTPGSCGRVEAAFAFTFRGQGADVVAIGSRSIDVADLSLTGEDVLLASGVSGLNAVAGVAGIVAVYHGIMGPGGLGVGGPVVASRGEVTRLPLTARTAFWGVPPAYVSGSALSSSMEFAARHSPPWGWRPERTPGPWGAGANADSFTMRIGAAAVPEPGSCWRSGPGCWVLPRCASGADQRRDGLAVARFPSPAAPASATTDPRQR